MASGKFKKGESGNLAGKPPGTKNKRTLEWEEFGRDFLAENLPKSNEIIQEWLSSDDPDLQYKALNLVTGMLEYFKPKLQRTQLAGDQNERIQIVISDKI